MSQKPTRAQSAARAVLTISALALPTLSLLPLGSLYLWDKGYLLEWALASLCIVAFVTFLQWRWLAKAAPSPDVSDARRGEVPANPVWNAEEQRAWADVQAIARSVDLDKMTDADAVTALGQRTIRTVASRLHPGKDDAVWAFTIPEALAISERVSRRLSAFVNENIPFGDRLTVAQVLAIYRWRSLADLAEKAYDVWRIARFANPATALTHEARERLAGAMMQWGRAHVTRQLAEKYVHEVGRAAIDLYGGRLRISASSVETDLDDDLEAEDPIALGGPVLRVLVAGGTRAERDRTVELIRANQQRRVEALATYLSGDESKARAARALALHAFAGRSEFAAPSDAEDFATDIFAADVVVWLSSEAASDPLARPGVLDALKDEMRSRRGVLPPEPLLVAITDGQKLKTGTGDGGRPAEAALAELFARPIGVAARIRLRPDHEADDTAAIVGAIEARADRAQRVKLVRRIARMKSGNSLARSGWQALGATGALARSIASSLGARLGL